MIKCDILNKTFDSVKDRLKAIKANKATIIASKKSEIKTKVNTGILGFYDEETESVKAIPNLDKDYIYPVISNTNYLDSHKDVHLNGSMTKTAKDQNRKVYYVTDHKLEVDSIIATPKNVEVMIKELNWTDLGRNYTGKTEALIYKIAKDKIIHSKFKQMIEDGEDLQNSIRMQYMKIDIAFNSEDEEFKEEFKVFKELESVIVNKDAIEKNDVIFAVRELKIHMEGSAVLFGSNDATPIKNFEPSEDTQETAAEKSLQTENQFYINLISK